MEQRDVAEVKSANERLNSEIEKLKKTLQKLTRSQAGVRLDLNLEKGRIAMKPWSNMIGCKRLTLRLERDSGH